MANQHGKDVGQVVFRYLIQKGYAIAYLTQSAERMVTNPQVFDFQLSDEEMQRIDGLNRVNRNWGLPSPYDVP
jgi:methylglyoxal/glyoxal reductase